MTVLPLALYWQTGIVACGTLLCVLAASLFVSDLPQPLRRPSYGMLSAVSLWAAYEVFVFVQCGWFICCVGTLCI